MELNLSKDEKDKLKRDLRSAKPYEENDIAVRTLDGDWDIDRIRATMAKKFLDLTKEDEFEMKWNSGADLDKDEPCSDEGTK